MFRSPPGARSEVPKEGAAGQNGSADRNAPKTQFGRIVHARWCDGQQNLKRAVKNGKAEGRKQPRHTRHSHKNSGPMLCTGGRPEAPLEKIKEDVTSDYRDRRGRRDHRGRRDLRRVHRRHVHHDRRPVHHRIRHDLRRHLSVPFAGALR
jgi:hypothetical protein